MVEEHRRKPRKKREKSRERILRIRKRRINGKEFINRRKKRKKKENIRKEYRGSGKEEAITLEEWKLGEIRGRKRNTKEKKTENKEKKNQW